MKNRSTFLLYILTVFLLNACSDETHKSNTETIKNPVDTYLDSRIDAMDIAKKSLKESSARNTEQDEKIKAFYK